jgi:hypothetical protein
MSSGSTKSFNIILVKDHPTVKRMIIRLTFKKALDKFSSCHFFVKMKSIKNI